MKSYQEIKSAVQSAFREVFGPASQGEDDDTLYSPDDEAQAVQCESALQTAVGLDERPQIFKFVSGVNVQPVSVNSVTRRLLGE